MDKLLEFAYAAKPDARMLTACLSDIDAASSYHYRVIEDTGNQTPSSSDGESEDLWPDEDGRLVSKDDFRKSVELRVLQHEVRTMLEAAAHGKKKVEYGDPPGATVMFTGLLPGRSLQLDVTLVRTTTGRKTPKGPRYSMRVTGRLRDVTLFYTSRLIAEGGSEQLKECAVCSRVFMARRSTSTLCTRPSCKQTRDQEKWKRWVASPQGKRKRIESLTKRYEAEGWALGARGGLGGRRRGRKKR